MKFRRTRTLHRKLDDGLPVRLRPLEADDLAQAEQFFAGMSEQSRYMRFMAPMPRLTESAVDMVERTLWESRSFVLVAVADVEGHERIIGGVRIVPTDRSAVCEFSVIVLDRWQGKGLGTVLLHEVEKHARRLGFHELEGIILSTNSKMLAAAQHNRYRLAHHPDDPTVVMAHRHLYTPGLGSSPYRRRSRSD
jgi:acetyltransferase